MKPLPRWLGLVLLAALALHAASKVWDGLSLTEMLWACHLAALLVAVGLLTRAHVLVWTGFIFHVAIGVPSFVIDAIRTGTTTPTSILVHALPLTFGHLVTRQTGLSYKVVPLAWGFWIACQALAYFVTDPRINVNLVHAPWAPFADLGVATSRVMNAVAAAAFLTVATFAYRLAASRAMLARDAARRLARDHEPV